MKIRAIVLLTVVVLVASVSAASRDAVHSSGPPPNGAAAPPCVFSPSRPLAFEPNVGQGPQGTSYLARTASGTLCLEGGSLLWIPGQATSPGEGIRLTFEGADRLAVAAGLERQAGVSNYFMGRDPGGWRTGVPHFGKVMTSGLYSGVDLVLYGNGEHLEFDLVLGAGARPDSIRMRVEGESALALTAQGDLKIQGCGPEICLRRPLVYQETPSGKREVAAAYALVGGRTVALRLGAYDPSRPLVVDPVLVFSTYHGAEYQDWAKAVATDAAGNIFVAGFTSSNQFPTTPGAFQTTHWSYRTDGFVSKFDPTGATLLYSTYLGGTSTSGASLIGGLAVDAAGDAYVTGNTGTTSFPLVNAYQSAFKSATQAFVSKLNPAGSALLYSTYLGGSGSSNYGQGIAVDASGSAYVAGYTNSTDFPTSGAVQAAYAGGGYDAFLTKFTPAGNALAYSTYLGGSGNDQANAVAVDGQGDAFVAGGTASSDYPLMNPAQATLGGAIDVFLTKLNPAGSALLFSTYLGGSSQDSAQALALGPTGDPYLTGSTYSRNFPTVNALQPAGDGIYEDAFLARYSSAGSVVFSTYYGGDYVEWPYGIAVDHAGNVFVAGVTGSVDFPMTTDALQPAIASPPVYHSVDGGATFANIVGGLATSEVDDLLVVPGAPNLMFAAGAYNGLFRSTDGGASWSRCGGGIPPRSPSAFASCLAYVPGSPGKILAGIYYHGLYASTDGGDTWSFVSGTETRGALQRLVSDPAHPNRVFMGTNGQGFHVSTDGGATWSPVPGFSPAATVSAVAFAPTNPQIIFVGLNPGGMFKSTDGGGTWNDLSAGLRTPYVSSIAVDPTDPLVVYDGTGNGGLDKSIDGGLTWTSTDFDYTYLNALAVDPQDHLRLWAACEGGLLTSADGGATWSFTRIRATYAKCMVFSHPSPAAPAELLVGGMGLGDGFLAKISADGQHLMYSTFLGGTGYEYEAHVTLDPYENIVMAGATAAHDFPTLDPRQAANGAPRYTNAFVAKMRQCAISCTASGPSLLSAGVPGSFTATVTPTDCFASAAYDWDFGDGSAHGTAQNPTHAYASSGVKGWTLKATVGDQICTKTGSVTVVDPPVIALLKKVSPPFTIVVTGSNLQSGIRVFIDGAEWTSLQYKKVTKIKLTGGTSLKAAVPKGVSKTFRFVNPDGGEASTTWSW